MEAARVSDEETVLIGKPTVETPTKPHASTPPDKKPADVGNSTAVVTAAGDQWKPADGSRA